MHFFLYSICNPQRFGQVGPKSPQRLGSPNLRNQVTSKSCLQVDRESQPPHGDKTNLPRENGDEIEGPLLKVQLLVSCIKTKPPKAPLVFSCYGILLFIVPF